MKLHARSGHDCAFASVRAELRGKASHVNNKGALHSMQIPADQLPIPCAADEIHAVGAKCCGDCFSLMTTKQADFSGV